MRPAYPTHSLAILVPGVLVPLALLPILIAVRAPWTVTSPLPSQLFVGLSAIGGGPGGVVLAGLIIVALIRQGRHWGAAFMVSSVAVAHVASRLLRVAFDVARPESVDANAGRLAGIPESAVLAVVGAMDRPMAGCATLGPDGNHAGGLLRVRACCDLSAGRS